MTQLLSETQVSEETGITVRRLQTMRFRHEGPAYRKLGRTVRYAMEDVRTWLENCKVEPGEGAAVTTRVR